MKTIWRLISDYLSNIRYFIALTNMTYAKTITTEVQTMGKFKFLLIGTIPVQILLSNSTAMLGNSRLRAIPTFSFIFRGERERDEP